MNAPDRLDAIQVPAGLPKIQITLDEKTTNAATYRVMREDHTLGHMMRMELLKNPKVRFAGYKHPHPLENDILIKVHTAPGHQPTAVLAEAAKSLEDVFTVLQASYRSQVQRIRAQEEEIGGAGADMQIT